jgi:hypothetical protein
MAPRGRPRILTDEERTDKKKRSLRYKCATRDRNFKWVLANPEKRKALEAFTKALKVGQIVRPGECSYCGKKGKVNGHHEDYSKPLVVIWLCSSCHPGVHRGRIQWPYITLA